MSVSYTVEEINNLLAKVPKCESDCIEQSNGYLPPTVTQDEAISFCNGAADALQATTATTNAIATTTPGISSTGFNHTNFSLCVFESEECSSKIDEALFIFSSLNAYCVSLKKLIATSTQSKPQATGFVVAIVSISILLLLVVGGTFFIVFLRRRRDRRKGSAASSLTPKEEVGFMISNENTAEPEPSLSTLHSEPPYQTDRSLEPPAHSPDKKDSTLFSTTSHYPFPDHQQQPPALPDKTLGNEKESFSITEKVEPSKIDSGLHESGEGKSEPTPPARTSSKKRIEGEITSWNADTVSAALMTAGVNSGVVDTLRAHGTDGLALLDLDHTKLLSMGLDDPGARHVLLCAVGVVRDIYGSDLPPPQYS
ncbi:hypothetical protein HDU97_008533 [Phlyctochytrium planicorne]|nr:hypothetical protein HDU97_008533 [Phlyctochytrium planicorne]